MRITEKIVNLINKFVSKNKKIDYDEIRKSIEIHYSDDELDYLYQVYKDTFKDNKK